MVLKASLCFLGLTGVVVGSVYVNNNKDWIFKGITKDKRNKPNESSKKQNESNPKVVPSTEQSQQPQPKDNLTGGGSKSVDPVVDSKNGKTTESNGSPSDVVQEKPGKDVNTVTSVGEGVPSGNEDKVVNGGGETNEGTPDQGPKDSSDVGGGAAKQPQEQVSQTDGKVDQPSNTPVPGGVASEPNGEKKDGGNPEGTVQTGDGKPNVQDSEAKGPNQQEKTLDQDGQSKGQGVNVPQEQKDVSEKDQKGSTDVSNLKANPDGLPSTPTPQKDYQCKFDENNDYESETNKKELKDFLKSKGGVGLQILGEDGEDFKCAKDVENSKLSGLKGYLSKDNVVKSSLSAPQTKPAEQTPLAVKRKDENGWTVFETNDDGTDGDGLESIQEPKGQQ